MPLQNLYFLAEWRTTAPTRTIRMLNRSIERAGVVRVDHQRSSLTRFVARVTSKLRVNRNLWQRSGRTYLVGLMWPNDHRMFPYAYTYEMIPYVFDCWPPFYDRWESLFHRNRIQTAFFSARQSAAYFQERMPNMRSHWLPEACDPDDYLHDRPLVERSIDVLELGRKFRQYHDGICELLEAGDFNFTYSVDGSRKTLFPGHDSLRKALVNTKISICFPKSMTHPVADDREFGAGSVETVTLRYFEAMASKCILLGHCPDELRNIYGYNPVIQYDEKRPFEQIQDLLKDPASHQEQVDANYDRLLQVGTWDARVEQMLETLSRPAKVDSEK